IIMSYLSLLLFINLLFFFLFSFFLIVTRYKFTLGKYCVEIVNFKFSILLFVVLIMHIAFVSYTGVGKVFGGNTNIFSPIFSITAPSAIFFFYYLIVRENAGKIFFY
ncbi:hypothetical protein, partial [Yersinia pestis]|uniref:hypothetical protein n=1 Tax=Yersinia pestis TaxID=632 RepID=UPI001F5270DD